MKASLAGRSTRAAMCLCVVLALPLPPIGLVRAEGLVESLVRRFAQSDFEFMRAQSNAPFLPLAWATLTGYEEGTFTRPDGGETAVTFHQTSISQGAFVPIPLGKRDALVTGEWLSLTQFELDNSAVEDLDVISAAVPVGWIRQSTPDWQLAAFVAPLGHKTHEDSWYWETLGGVFTRYVSNDRTAWIFGVYVDLAPLEDFYTPYLGATFILNERWTISAVMPWPAITYAPSTDTLFRLGVVPSGASWSIEPGEQRPRMSLSAWDFGLSAQRRIYRNLWFGVEAGVSGLRGLTIVGGDWQAPDTRLDNTAFALLTLNLRPGSPSGR
jgi:hypothetical protein